jgi:hypothetical protein
MLLSRSPTLFTNTKQHIKRARFCCSKRWKGQFLNDATIRVLLRMDYVSKVHYLFFLSFIVKSKPESQENRNWFTGSTNYQQRKVLWLKVCFGIFE